MNLHSTIFILKPERALAIIYLLLFTFYYIYIKTFDLDAITDGLHKFTFYYIYIKTEFFYDILLTD